MSDKENKNEFVFEDENENNTQEYTESSYSGSTENIKSIFKNKRIVTLAGGIAGVWLLSFILENVIGGDDTIVDKAESSSDIQQATSELTSVEEPANTDIKELTEDTKEPEAPVNKEVEAKVDNNSETIQSLQNMNDKTNMQLDRLSGQIASLSDQVSTIAAANSEVADKVDSIEAKMKAKEEAAKKAAQPKLENYYIKALIHGRAWLSGPNKEYITVTAGDEVKDYGKIVEIYPEQGAITTSSGRVIRFAND